MTANDTLRPIALVTGGNRGIGLEIGRQLAEQGMTVLLGARDADKATEAASALAETGLEVHPIVVDVSDETSVQELASTLQQYGRLDVLVNNAAAFADWSEVASTADLRAARDVLETNLFGPWRVTQAVLPLLRRSAHPRIVNVSSGGGSHGDDMFGLATNGGSAASYGVSKAALNALTTKFAAELGPSGILVNAVCPGFTATAPGMEAMGARPASESARGIVWAALLPDDGPNGGFFRDQQPLPW